MKTPLVLRLAIALRFTILNATWSVWIFALFLAPVLFLPDNTLATEKIADKSLEVLPIVNGSDADTDSPWMVGLLVKISAEDIPLSELLFCGGSLIGDNWVLTAAHCAISYEPSEIQVFLGSNNLNGPQGEVVDVREIIVHPFYAESLSGNDIALIRLENPVDYEPIALGNESSDLVLSDQPAVVLGWGNTSEKPEESCELVFEDNSVNENDYYCLVKDFGLGVEAQSNLLEARETIISDAECMQFYEQNFADTYSEYSPLGDSSLSSQNLCTFDPVESGDPCYGDSGSPLVVVNDGMVQQVGITSTGLGLGGCIDPTAINVYTKVAYYLDFIEDVMGRDPGLGFASYCPKKAELSVDYQPVDDHSVLVVLSWKQVEGATGYLLRYLDTAIAETLGKMEIDADTIEVSAQLPRGFEFLVSLQAQGIDCDGPASELVTLKR